MGVGGEAAVSFRVTSHPPATTPPSAPCSLPVVAARAATTYLHPYLQLQSGFLAPWTGEGGIELAQFGRMESPSANVCDKCGASFDSKQKLRAHEMATKQRISKPELRAEIRRLADDVGHVPKSKEMAERGAYSPATYQRRYDSWDDALAAAGVDPETRRTSDETIIEDIRRLAEESGTAPTASEMANRGQFSVTLAQNRFGSWNEALRRAGFQPSNRHSISDEALVDEINRLYSELDRAPTAEDMEERGSFSIRPYLRRFDTWQSAVRAAGYEPVGYPSGPANPMWKSEPEGNRYYGPRWQQRRRQVLVRDDFECQTPGCEISNTEHQERFGRALGVHHIQPLGEFERNGTTNYARANADENLVTVCAEHHSLWERMVPLRPDTRHHDD